jgi:hypothetical protein
MPAPGRQIVQNTIDAQVLTSWRLAEATVAELRRRLEAIALAARTQSASDAVDAMMADGNVKALTPDDLERLDNYLDSKKPQVN